MGLIFGGSNVQVSKVQVQVNDTQIYMHVYTVYCESTDYEIRIRIFQIIRNSVFNLISEKMYYLKGATSGLVQQEAFIF